MLAQRTNSVTESTNLLDICLVLFNMLTVHELFINKISLISKKEGVSVANLKTIDKQKRLFVIKTILLFVENI